TQLAQALEARADSTLGADAADLLLEAGELARAAGDDPRSTALLRKARGVHPHSGAARNALLSMPGLPLTERIDLLAEEARAAEHAEWRVGDPRRALDLYKSAAHAYPQAAFAWAQLGRLLAWTGKHAEAAEAFEQLAAVAQPMTERNEARRWAASLHAHRAG